MGSPKFWSFTPVPGGFWAGDSQERKEFEGIFEDLWNEVEYGAKEWLNGCIHPHFGLF